MEKKIILWTEELKTGIEWQDFQHKEFLNMTNDLFDMFYETKGHIDFEATIQFLESYAHHHFGIEERYMKRLNYPETEQHLDQHIQFKQFISDILTNSRTSLLEAARICNKLNNWFANHIKVVDMKLGAFLRDHQQI